MDCSWKINLKQFSNNFLINWVSISAQTIKAGSTKTFEVNWGLTFNTIFSVIGAPHSTNTCHIGVGLNTTSFHGTLRCTNSSSSTSGGCYGLGIGEQS